MATLRDQAQRLGQVLQEIVHDLGRYGVDYTSRLAAALRPQVDAFTRAVIEERSRIHAQEILSDIAPVMEEVSGAATKGEMPIFADQTLLDRYWELHTIFRETRFAKEAL